MKNQNSIEFLSFSTQTFIVGFRFLYRATIKQYTLKLQNIYTCNDTDFDSMVYNYAKIFQFWVVQTFVHLAD